MIVRVRLFAGLREHAGFATRDLELEEGASCADAAASIEELEGALPDGLAFAVNRSYAEPAHVLEDGDELALIPPVSGGARRGACRLTHDPVVLDELVKEVASEQAGAIATFTGTTRAHSRGRAVHHLEYEAYRGMAEAELERIAAELEQKHRLCGISITHRLGRVEIGETSVAIAVSAPHRAAAFAACREAIDTLKETVPLWKKEVYEGGEEWIGRGS
jgi:molybdopterin synthase catalytic subunit